jgi:hypothetical protein
VPLLGDIPLLGFLFSTTSNSSSKNNLLIFITPHVINDRSDFAAIVKRKIEERNKFIDMNFSKSKQRQIRDTIKMHREDLLEFSGEIPPPESIGGATSGLSPKAGVMMKGSQPPATVPAPKYQASPVQKYQSPSGPPPVITVPESGITSRSYEIPVTTPYVAPPPPPPVQTWKPIVPPTEYPKAIPQKTPVKEQTITEVPQKIVEPKMKEEAVKTPVPQWLPTVPKDYKRPVVPTPAFEGSVAPKEMSKATAPQANVESKAETKPKTEEKKPRPVISVPESNAGQPKLWKKPAPKTRNGETDLEY